MSKPSLEHDSLRLREELGFLRWQAIGHFVSDGDYLGLIEGDYRGAIAEYEKAWELLSTPWQLRTGGADLLEGIAEFALQSEDPELADETFSSLLPRAADSDRPLIRVALGKLALLAGKQQAATEQFRCALALGGTEAFAEEDRSYLALVEHYKKPS